MGKKKSKEARAVASIQKAMDVFGWTFLAMPDQDLEAPVKGMIIGTEAYVTEVLEAYDHAKAKRNSKKNS